MTAASKIKDINRLLNIAYALSFITIFYNIAEGIISTFFGYSDETIALFGFGIDSFVEVISGIGVGHMIWRMKRDPVTSRDIFEKQALYVTGISFYFLTFGIAAGSVFNILYNVKPGTTLPGIIVSIVSILTMWILYKYKMSIGSKLNSEPIIADAKCTKTCFYLSFILLFSSAFYAIFKIGFIDIIGGSGIAYFAFKEGKEAIGKARSNSLSCSCACDD